MNEKSRLSKIFIIVICVLLIIGVSFAKIFTKDNRKEETLDTTATLINTEEIEKNQQAEVTVDSTEEQPGNIIEDPNSPTDPELEQYLNQNQLENIDDSLYTEDAGDTYGEQMSDVRIWFSNFDPIDDVFPLWAYGNLLEKLQSYIDLNIQDPVEEMTIIEDSVTTDDKSGFFSIDLNNGRICTVNIDYEKQEIMFGDHRK